MIRVSTIAALIACMVITGCTTTVAGQPRPAEVSADHPGGEPPKTPPPTDRDPQAVTVALRQLDACAVIDLNAAKAGGTPEASLLPIGPHACMLAPTASYSPGDHGVEVRIGDGSNDFFQYNGKPVTVGGAKAYEYRDYSDISRRCDLYLPVSFTRALTFKYDVFTRDNIDACQVVRQVANASVAKLQNPDALTVDTAKRPFSAWDGCFFLATLLGQDAENYTYKPDGVRDPFSGCKTTQKKTEASQSKLDQSTTPALEIAYDQVPTAPKQGRQIGGKLADVSSYSGSCKLTWNQADSATGNKWYAALVVKLTAATCDSAAQLAEKAVQLAASAPSDASAQPQRPLLYKPEEKDSAAVGSCVDFGADPGHANCEPYHEVSVPQGTDKIMAAAAKNRNMECAVFADAVKAQFGPDFKALTWGEHCFFVEPTHTLQLRVNVDPKYVPSDYGKGAVYTERQETQLGGKPAVTFWNKSKTNFDIYLSPFNDLNREGNVHITVEALRGRGDGSRTTVTLDQAKADTGAQVITQVTQKYFAG